MFFHFYKKENAKNALKCWEHFGHTKYGPEGNDGIVMINELFMLLSGVGAGLRAINGREYTQHNFFY